MDCAQIAYDFNLHVLKRIYSESGLFKALVNYSGTLIFISCCTLSIFYIYCCLSILPSENIIYCIAPKVCEVEVKVEVKVEKLGHISYGMFMFLLIYSTTVYLSRTAISLYCIRNIAMVMQIFQLCSLSKLYLF